jgi:hypothetical protein
MKFMAKRSSAALAPPAADGQLPAQAPGPAGGPLGGRAALAGSFHGATKRFWCGCLRMRPCHGAPPAPQRQGRLRAAAAAGGAGWRAWACGHACSAVASCAFCGCVQTPAWVGCSRFLKVRATQPSADSRGQFGRGRRSERGGVRRRPRLSPRFPGRPAPLENKCVHALAHMRACIGAHDNHASCLHLCRRRCPTRRAPGATGRVACPPAAQGKHA